MMEKSAAQRPAEVKPTDVKPAETANAPADQHHRVAVLAAREKAVAKTVPSPAASPAAPVEAAAASPVPAEEYRDANDLARAAIERLRSADKEPRTQEAFRTPEAPRLQEAPRTVTPPATASIRPLPPPITVTTPPAEAPASPAPYTASIRNDDLNRPVPPADIPPPPSVDLRADATKLATRTTTMAQDMLSAAKSMFHAVLPNNSSGQSSSASQFTD